MATRNRTDIRRGELATVKWGLLSVGAAVRAVALFAAVAHARGYPAQTGARGLARIASNWLTRA